MVRRLRLIVLAWLLTLISLPANDASAQWFKKSVVNLTDLSEVPGTVLEPGTYVLKAEEGASTARAVIQLLNQDESQILTMFIAVPDHRQRPETDVVVTFHKGITSGPRPIQTWYYPGEMNGYEFVYPTPRAREIAKTTEDHVMAAESRDAAIIAITSSGAEVPIYDAVGKTSTKSGDDDVSREKPKSTSPDPAPAKKGRRGGSKPNME